MVRRVTNFYDHKIIPERVHPGWSGNMLIQFLLRIDIKDENASIRQVSRYAGEELLPTGKAQDMVDGIKDTADHIELFRQIESHHVLIEYLAISGTACCAKNSN